MALALQPDLKYKRIVTDKRTTIADLRREYTRAGLRRTELDADPMVQFNKWFEQALAANLAEPNAMTLATADRDGRPSARTVLLKARMSVDFVFSRIMRAAKGVNWPAIRMPRW